ncbi:MAG: hypothetical protein MUP28_03745, partial [Candidatus Aminicenantes bacterium]|nr:hypothetical protein [Candidatus Aminicenantes bacterium]
QSNIIRKLDEGTLLEAQKKVGDWYEVAVQTDVGISVVGYIHEMFVEVETAEEEKTKETMKEEKVREPEPMPEVRTQRVERADAAQKFELSLYGGYALTQVNGQSNYTATWSSWYLDSATETTNITGKSPGAGSIGASFAYFFTPNFGIQLSGEFLLKGNIPMKSHFNFDYTWYTGSSYNETADWKGTGGLNSIPLSLDLVGRFGGGTIGGSVSAGATLFMNSFEADSAIGFGVTQIWRTYYWWGYTDTQAVDALRIPAVIDKTSWTAFGGNLGASMTFKMSGKIGLFLDSRYFLCPAKEFDWGFVLGSYDGIFYDTITGFEFDQDSLEFIAEGNKMKRFKVNPSFFRIAAGIKFYMGN